MAYDSIDPIGPERFDVLAGLIMQAVLAPHSKRLPRLEDLIPKWDSGPRKSLVELEGALRAWAAAHKAQRRRKKDKG